MSSDQSDSADGGVPAPPVTCPRCATSNPAAARFCQACGDSLRETEKRSAYAANPSESVASFAVVSTLMPHASDRTPQTYRWALAVGLAIPVLAWAFGALPFALATAVFVVPVVYVVYLYDMNLWEDAPVPVVLAAFALSGALAVGFTWLWRYVLFGDALSLSLSRKAGTFDLTQFLVPSVLVPVVAMVLMLIGPLYLASRPAFDDLMDGLTFGVVSGVAYAAFETLVLNWSLLRSGAETADGSVWLSVIITAALIKPLVYGSAAGLAAAQFSGLGEGYAGFTGTFVVRTLEAMLFLVAFQAGLYLTGLVEGATGAVLGMLWGLLVALVALLRVRTALHKGLIEGALEAAARASGSKWAAGQETFCAECRMPLLEGALFCVACGESVRARPKTGPRPAVPAPAGSAPGGSTPVDGGEGSA